MFFRLILDKIKQIKYNQIILAILFLVLFFIGFWRLSYSPATWYDEGINAGIAKSLVEDGIYSLKVGQDEFVETREYLITTNYTVLLPVALSLKIFGNSIASARIPMIIYLILFVVVAYLITKKWFGKKNALLTIFLIVLFLPFYGNGKSVLGEVAGLFYLLLGLYFLDSKKLYKLLLSGLFLGLSISTKPFFILLFPALLIGEIYKAVNSEFRKPLVYFCIITTIFIPILFWFWTVNPSFSFNNLSSIFRYYSNSYADNTNLLYLIFSNLKRFITETTPIHFAVMFVALIWAIAYMFKKREVLSEQVVLVVFIILNFLWYLKTPGWYRYFFPSHLILFIFFPFVLKKIFSKKIAFGIVIFFIIIQTFILVSKHNEPLYFSSETQKVAEYVNRNINKENKLLILNGPSIAFLLEDRIIEQYIRINPKLVFAPKYIRDNLNDINSNFIIVGSFGKYDLKIESFVHKKYKKIKAIGHYRIYKLKRS